MIITIFGITFGRKPIPPVPSPLDTASADYTAVQFAILKATTLAENATADLHLYLTRRDRLRETIRELSDDKTLP